MHPAELVIVTDPISYARPGALLILEPTFSHICSDILMTALCNLNRLIIPGIDHLQDCQAVTHGCNSRPQYPVLRPGAGRKNWHRHKICLWLCCTNRFEYSKNDSEQRNPDKKCQDLGGWHFSRRKSCSHRHSQGLKLHSNVKVSLWISRVLGSGYLGLFYRQMPCEL